MDKIEHNPNENKKKEKFCSEDVELISLRATEIKDFIQAVEEAESKLNAIQKVRPLLKRYFPEISKIPEPASYPKNSLAKGTEDGLIIRGRIFASPPSNEFTIAKNIVDLLWEN